MHIYAFNFFHFFNNILFSITGSMDKDKFINVNDSDRPEVFEGEFGDKYLDNIAEDNDGKPNYVT